jgi:acetyltransferase-like isoleucine patch superfamily enzyme
MKTDPLDYVLCSICITVTLALAVGTTWLLSAVSPWQASPYQVVLDVAVFLLAYGIHTALLLAVIRRLRPFPVGDFSMDSPEFRYWKLTSVLTDLGVKALRPYTTVFTRPLVFAAFGAHIGRKPAFGGDIVDFPLVHLGDLCIVGHNSLISAHAMTQDRIVLGPVRIESHAVVGAHAVVFPGASLGQHAVLAPNSVAAPGTKIGAGELWGGNPAVKLGDIKANHQADPTAAR